MHDQLAQSPSIHGADLLNKDTSGSAFDLGLGPERRGSCASRCWGNDDYLPGQEFIRLNHHGKTIAVLPVALVLGQTKSVDVTAKHEALPSTPRQPASPPCPPHRPPGRLPPPPTAGHGGGGGGWDPIVDPWPYTPVGLLTRARYVLCNKTEDARLAREDSPGGWWCSGYWLCNKVAW